MLVCRRLQQKKEKSVDKKRQRVEDQCGGFARLQGKMYRNKFHCIYFTITNNNTAVK